jgi:hypothetical protein
MTSPGPEEALRNLGSIYAETRQAALRATAYHARRYRRSGRPEEARRLDEAIIRRYRVERNRAVRLCVIRLAAPIAGEGNPAMGVFLRSVLAEGEFSGDAALSLAMLRSPGALNDILPLTRHPSPATRYQAAVALTVLADPAGRAAVFRVRQSMDHPGWPARLEGITLAEAKLSLDRMAERAFTPRQP